MAETREFSTDSFLRGWSAGETVEMSMPLVTAVRFDSEVVKAVSLSLPVVKAVFLDAAVCPVAYPAMMVVTRTFGTSSYLSPAPVTRSAQFGTDAFLSA